MQLKAKSNSATDQKSNNRETVIVIDSLSSISRFLNKPLQWVMLLLQEVCSQDCSLILTLRSDESAEYGATLNGLKDLMVAHIKVSQIRQNQDVCECDL